MTKYSEQYRGPVKNKQKRTHLFSNTEMEIVSLKGHLESDQVTQRGSNPICLSQAALLKSNQPAAQLSILGGYGLTSEACHKSRTIK